MFGIAERLAQAPDANPQIVEKCLVVAVSPEQRHQFTARLPMVRTEHKIGKQHAVAFGRKRHAFTAT